jgi:tetratricopeptide (TPR) repeat protein
VEEAERELAAALALDPAANGLPGSGVARERSRLHYALGGIAANRGREDDALARFRRAAELDPGYAEPHVQIGNLHGRAGRLEAALSAFGRALELDPELAQARLQRATTLMDLGRFAEAIPELERYLASHPDDQRARALLRTVDPPPE